MMNIGTIGKLYICKKGILQSEHFLPKLVFGKKGRKLFRHPRLVPSSPRVLLGSTSSVPSPSGKEQTNTEWQTAKHPSKVLGTFRAMCPSLSEIQ
jgi:hypothetical protein